MNQAPDLPYAAARFRLRSVTGRSLASCLMLLAVGSSQSLAWDLGEVGDDGYTFIYDQQQDPPYSTGWWGRDSGNYNDKAEVHIKASGKTVFGGTLLIECGTLSMQWTEFEEWSSADLVPDAVWQNAGGLFCSN